MSPHYTHHTDHGPRQTSRAIVIKDGHLLLMERWRDGLHYFSIPGGGIDPGEHPEDAALRELKEETSVSAGIDRLVYEMHDAAGPHHHYFYLCTYLTGEPHLPADSEEARQGPHNRFRPVWLPANELVNIEFNYWEPIRKLLIHDVGRGFAKKVKITAV